MVSAAGAWQQGDGGTIVGDGPVFRRAILAAERAARFSVGVLLTGETGTGKEVVAEFIHATSGRPGAFVPVNCAAFPATLLESELFGHVRGAFTGAIGRQGLIAAADGGTLFLDEVAEMPAEVQAKVLRALQTGEVRRVGDTRTWRLDVRVVAATNRDLQALVESGGFREDLFYRLKGYEVCLPPLRERGRDVLLLARAFLDELPVAKRLSRGAQRLLLAYGWPGNVRELQNVIRAAAIDAGRTIAPEHLAPHMVCPPEPPSSAPRKDVVLDVVDRDGAASAADVRSETALPRGTLARVLDEMVGDGILQRVGTGRTTRYVRAQAQPPGGSLAARQQLILRHATETGRITRQQAAELTGVAIRTASRDLDALCAAGLLVRDGRSGKAAGYTLP